MLWGTYAEQHSAVKDRLHLNSIKSLSVRLKSYFFEAHFQVVLRLLLIIRKRLVNQKLLFHMDLKQKTNSKNFSALHYFFVPIILFFCYVNKTKQKKKPSPANTAWSDCSQVKPKPPP